MKRNAANYFRALLTICTGLALAFIVCAFMATPVNPSTYRATMAKIDTAVQTGAVFHGDEFDAYLAVPSQPAPPFLFAVLDWHAWLLVPSLVLAFLALRPAIIPSFAASCLATAFMYYFVAPRSALVLFASACIGMLGAYGLGKIRPRAPREAA